MCKCRCCLVSIRSTLHRFFANDETEPSEKSHEGAHAGADQCEPNQKADGRAIGQTKSRKFDLILNERIEPRTI